MPNCWKTLVQLDKTAAGSLVQSQLPATLSFQARVKFQKSMKNRVR
jgi:hypothetical protein